MNKQNYSFSRMNRALQTVVCFVLVCLSSLAVRAADPVDWGEMELDKAYDYTLFTANSGKFTAPQSGIVTCTSTSGDFLYPYSDADHTQELEFQTNYDAESHIYYELSVTEGQTVYFYKSFVMNGGQFMLTMSSETGLKLLKTSPEAGSRLSAAGSPQVLFYFNSNVKISGAEIACGDYSESISANISGSTVFFNCGESLMGLLNAGRLQENDIVTFRLKNVRMASDESVRYGEDGTCEVGYVFAGKPVQLTSVSGLLDENNKFLSFWRKGDARGMLTLSFDGDLLVPEAGSQSHVVTLTYGNSEGDDGEYYVETLPYTVEGNVLVCDFTGKVRLPETMVTSGVNYGSVGLKVVNVRDAKGDYVYSGGSGTLGSFSYDLPYEVVQSSITTEFTPASGSSLQGKDMVELWITDYARVHFDGISFSYTDDSGNTATLVSDQYTATPDDEYEGAYILNITIPQEVKGHNDVVVTLANLSCDDGQDHSQIFTAKYNTFVLKSVRYQESAEAVATNLLGARLERLEAGGQILVNTNMNDQIGYMMYQIRDLNPDTPDAAIIKSMALLSKGEDGIFAAEIYGAGYKLMLGHTYRLEVTAYASEDDYNYGNEPLGKDYVAFMGATPPYVYSSVSLVSIDPANETELTQAGETTFTLEFDGMVSIEASTSYVVYGMGETLPFKSIEAVDRADGMSNIWKLTVDANTLQSVGNTLTLCVVATDYNFRRVQGNEGEDENTYFRFTYPLNFANFEVTISPESGTEVESLHQFTVSCSEGIGDAYSGQEIVLYNRGQFTVAATVKDIEQIIPEDQMDNWDYVVTSLRLTLDKEVTEPGSYTLDIPAGMFNLGTQFNQSRSQAMAANYVINGGGSGDAVNVQATPADGSKVEELSRIELLFPDLDEVGIGNGSPTLSKDGGQPTKLNDAELDWDIWNKATLNISPAITEAGVYTVSFPEGYFVDAQGNGLPAFTLTYTIGGAEAAVNVQATPADGSTVEELGYIELVFPDYEEINIANGRISISKDGGEPSKLNDAQLDWDVWNKATLSIVPAITEAGVYTISFPEGYFVDASYNALPAFTLTYTVKPGEGGKELKVEASPANGSTVGELSRIELVFPDYSEVAIGSGYPTLSKDGGEPSRLNDAEYDWDVWNKLILNITPAVTEAGNYLISFPEGYVLDPAGNGLPGFTLSYTVNEQSGIGHIQINGQSVDAVYTTGGVRIRATKQPLPAGVYIVNGKKVVVK